jgi:hypothetical protein
MLANLRACGFIVGAETPALSDEGRRFFLTLGIDVTVSPRTRRRLCRFCLDWSERRLHLGGLLGAQVLRHIYRERWARQDAGSRAVLFSDKGTRAFAARFLGPDVGP